MSLYNVRTSNNYIMAQFGDGVAVSEEIIQELVDNDFIGVKNARVLWKLNNIYSATSAANTLVTSADVVVGSKLIIRLNDGSLHEMIVSETTPVTNAFQIPTMWDRDKPRGNTTATYDTPGTESWRAFDASLTTFSYHSYAAVGSIEYRFQDSEEFEFTQYYLKGMGYDTVGFRIEGSINGLDWTQLDTRAISTPSGTYDLTENIGSYSRYRVTTNGTNDYGYAYSFNLLGDGVSIDTTAITNGETPDQVFLWDDKIYFNDQLATLKLDYPEYGFDGEKLHVYSQYDDVIIPDDASGDGDGSRTITTKVEFSSAGNCITEITSDLWQAASATPPFSVSKATAVNNAVTVYFPTDINTSGDLTVTTSITIDGGGAISPDSVLSNTDFIVLYFPADTISAGEVIEFVYDDTGTDNIVQAITLTELAAGSYAAINNA